MSKKNQDPLLQKICWRNADDAEEVREKADVSEAEGRDY